MEAVIVTAIALAFIMPTSAVLTNENTTIEIPDGAILQSITSYKQDALLKNNPQTLAAGSNLWITPFYGDDYMPAITIDSLAIQS